MRKLSLFNGMGCGFMAAVEAGLDVEITYTAEIDKFGNKASRAINPNEVQLGNIWGIRDAMYLSQKEYQEVMSMTLGEFEEDKRYKGCFHEKTIKAMESAFLYYKESLVKSRAVDWSKIDLVAAGSPCQGFSFAGRQLAFNDPRSALYFVFEEILFHIRSLNPNVKFFLENVNMLKEHASVITQRLGVEYIRVNSNHFTAQNRDRLYWTNFFPLDYGLFGDMEGAAGRPIVPKLPPASKEVIKDILQPYGTVPEKYYLSDKYVEYLFRNAVGHDYALHIQGRDSEEKAYGIVATDAKGPRKSSTIISECTGEQPSCTTEKPGGFQWFLKNLKHNSDKANSLLATSNKGPYANGTTVVMESTRELTPRFTKDAKAFWFEKPNGGVASEFGVIPVDHDIKANALITAKPSFVVEDMLGEYRLRRLTPLECCRLQGIPEWAIEPFLKSNYDTQLYKLLGNGWTVPVVAWFFKHLKK